MKRKWKHMQYLHVTPNVFGWQRTLSAIFIISSYRRLSEIYGIFVGKLQCWQVVGTLLTQCWQNLVIMLVWHYNAVLAPSYLGLEHQLLFFSIFMMLYLYCFNCVIYLYHTYCVLINSIIFIIIVMIIYDACKLLVQ